MRILRYAVGGAVLSVLLGVVLIMVFSALGEGAEKLVLALYILITPGILAGGWYGMYTEQKKEPDEGGQTDKPGT